MTNETKLLCATLLARPCFRGVSRTFGTRTLIVARFSDILVPVSHWRSGEISRWEKSLNPLAFQQADDTFNRLQR